MRCLRSKQPYADDVLLSYLPSLSAQASLPLPFSFSLRSSFSAFIFLLYISDIVPASFYPLAVYSPSAPRTPLCISLSLSLSLTFPRAYNAGTELASQIFRPLHSVVPARTRPGVRDTCLHRLVLFYLEPFPSTLSPGTSSFSCGSTGSSLWIVNWNTP